MTGFQRTGVLWRVTVCGLLLAVASCGGGSGASPDGGGGAAGTGGVTATGTPAEQCKKVSALICSRASACREADAAVLDVPRCELIQNTISNCAGATAPAAFGPCITDLQVLSCQSLFPPNDFVIPASCEAPLVAIPSSAAQNKCGELGHALCIREFRCLGITAPTAQDMALCDADYFFALDCPIAIGVSATIDQCVTDIQAVACPTAADGGAPDGGSTVATPPSCTTPITWVE